VRLSQLLSALPRPASPPSADPEITGLTADSRQVTPGALFVAVRGDHVDGHRFIPDALRRGAAAVVAETAPGEPGGARGAAPIALVPDAREALAWLAAAFHGFPARRLVMIGITGTDGKTTTANLLHSILVHAGHKTGLISTVNAVIGERTLDTGLHTTTPDAPEVQGYLAQMVAAGMTHCILEATSHGLAQRRVDACDFDVAVLTNITHEHLDYHGTLEAYRAAKARLFAGLATAARKPGQGKAAVLNLDDASFDYVRERTTAPVVTYGIAGQGGESAADVTALSPEFTPSATRFEIVSAPGVAGGARFAVETPLLGRFNVSNCLAAAAAALGPLGLSPQAVQAGIAAVAGVPGRLERIDLGQPFLAVVDFAHTPNALERALETARWMAASRVSGYRDARAAGDASPARPSSEATSTPRWPGRAMSTELLRPSGSETGRVIAVFGSAGLRDRAKRRLMPQISARLADLTVLTAEDPRTEALDDILAEMAEACAAAGGEEGRTFWRVPDRGAALRFAVAQAQPGDVVIACGKGHEQSMCFGTVEHPWDDRVALRAALAERLGVAGPDMPRLPTSGASSLA
jgi:UDP-N-acetylmuramoyl-L-alanyl-D-glutamate--2,6-diaminopimelate ligase